MNDIESVGSNLADILKAQAADYIEARLERSQVSQITYRGRNLEAVNRATSVGGNIRALVNGGWGFTSFNDLGEIRSRVEAAVTQARLACGEAIKLAEVAPIVDTQADPSSPGPLSIPLAVKKGLLDEYNDILWNTPGIQTSSISYGDRHKTVVLINSGGSYIRQARSDVTLRLSVIATDGNDVQQAGFSIGSRGDFDQIRGQHQQVAEMAQRAVALLTAPRASGGEYTVVLDPVLAGVFVHEAFGHLSESDFVYENEPLREIMTLGRTFGSRELNIVDTATTPGLRGSYLYDDEGVPATKTYLIREGQLVGRLHSRETAARMQEAATGNARAIDYHYPPLVRMTNTYIEPRSVSFDDIIGEVKQGIYAKNWYGGTTSMEMFTFSAGEAYMIRNGRVAEAIRPVTLSGNVFTTLGNIDAIGNDLEMNQGGGCGKGGQMPLPVANGSPHIRIRHCLIGGK